MKKYWRCFVCNDVHYGFRPPELCPTCKVRNAYVEISASEARRLGFRDGPDLSREDFRAAIGNFADANEFEVNPDEAKVALLIDGVFANEANHGLKYCPCRLMSKDFEEDLKIVCPCNFLVHETYQGRPDGECWCGLFVRRKP